MSRLSVAPTTGIYDSPTDALIAAARACNAPVHAIQYHRTGANGRSGWALWTHRDLSDLIAEGLRLTGYDVSILRGYTHAVVIHGVTAPAHQPGTFSMTKYARVTSSTEAASGSYERPSERGA